MKKTNNTNIQNFVAKNAQTSGSGEHKPKKGKNASRERQKRDWKKQNSLLKEINMQATHQTTDENQLLENMQSLSSTEINRLVDYVIDVMKDGTNSDPQEIAHQALENVAGMETASDSDKAKIVKRIENEVSRQQKIK